MKKILIFIVFVIVFAYVYTFIKPVLPSFDFSEVSAILKEYMAVIGG